MCIVRPMLVVFSFRRLNHAQLSQHNDLMGTYYAVSYMANISENQSLRDIAIYK